MSVVLGFLTDHGELLLVLSSIKISTIRFTYLVLQRELQRRREKLLKSNFGESSCIAVMSQEKLKTL